MSLIECPECESEVSSKADECPKCGYPIVEYMQEWAQWEQKERKKRRSAYLIGALCIAISLSFMSISLIGGIIMLLGSVFILPIVKEKISELLPFELPFLIFNIVATIFIMMGFSYSIRNGEPSQSARPIKSAPAPQAPTPKVQKDYSHLAYPITREGYPKIWHAWGEAWVSDINTHMPLAINKVAQQAKCDEPIDIGLSENQSIPQQKVVYFVTCSNGERFYINKTEVYSEQELSSQSDKMTQDSDSTLTSRCVDNLKNFAKNQATFNPSYSGARIVRDKTLGNIKITIPFTAQNTFGVAIDHTGVCVFKPDGAVDVSVVN